MILWLVTKQVQCVRLSHVQAPLLPTVSNSSLKITNYSSSIDKEASKTLKMAENCVLASVYFCSKIVSSGFFVVRDFHDMQGIFSVWAHVWSQHPDSISVIPFFFFWAFNFFFLIVLFLPFVYFFLLISISFGLSVSSLLSFKKM